MEEAPGGPSTHQAVNRDLKLKAATRGPSLTEARHHLYKVSLVLSKRITTTISGREIPESTYAPGEERAGQMPAMEHNSVLPRSLRRCENDVASRGLTRAASLEVLPQSSSLRERRSPAATDLPNTPLVHRAVYAQVYSPTQRTWRHVEFGQVNGSDSERTRSPREATLKNGTDREWPSAKDSTETDTPTRDCWQNVDGSAVNKVTTDNTSNRAENSSEEGSPTLTRSPTINSLKEDPSVAVTRYLPETRWQTDSNRSATKSPTQSHWQREDHTAEPLSPQDKRWRKAGNDDATGSQSASPQQRKNKSSQHHSWQKEDHTLITESPPKSPRHSTPPSTGTRTPPRITWHTTPLSILATSPPRSPWFSQPSSVATRSQPGSPWLNKPSRIIATSPPGTSWLNKSTSPTGNSWYNKVGSTKASSPGGAWHNKPSCIVATSPPTSSWESKFSSKTPMFPPESHGHLKSRRTLDTSPESCGHNKASNITATSPTEHHGHNTTSGSMRSSLPGSPGFNKPRKTMETSPPERPEHNSPKGTMEISPPGSPGHNTPKKTMETAPSESPGHNTPNRTMETQPGSPGHNTSNRHLKTPPENPQHNRPSNIMDTSLIECHGHNTVSNVMAISPPGSPGHNKTRTRTETSRPGSPAHNQARRTTETSPPGSHGHNKRRRTTETSLPGCPGHNKQRTVETSPPLSLGYDKVRKATETSPPASTEHSKPKRIIETSLPESPGHNTPNTEAETSPAQSSEYNKPSSILSRSLPEHPGQRTTSSIMYCPVTDNQEPIIDSRQMDTSPPRSPGHNQHSSVMIKSLREYSRHNNATSSIMDASTPECSEHNNLRSILNKLPQNCPEQNKTDSIMDPLPPESTGKSVHKSIIKAMPPGKPGHNIISNKVPSETSEQNESSSLTTKSLQEPTLQDEVDNTGTKSSPSHNTTCSITKKQQSNDQDVFDAIRTTSTSNCEYQNETSNTVSESLPNPMTQNEASRMLTKLVPQSNNHSLSRSTITEELPKIKSQDETSTAVQESLPNSINENETSRKVKESHGNHQISVNWAASESLGEENGNQVESTSGEPNSTAKCTTEIKDQITECDLLVKIPCQERDDSLITTPVIGNSSQNVIDSPIVTSPKENLAIKLHDDIAPVTQEPEILEPFNNLTNGDTLTQHSVVDNDIILFGETCMDNTGDNAASKLKALVTDNEVVVTYSEQNTMLLPAGTIEEAEVGHSISSPKRMLTSSTMTHLPPAEGHNLPHSIVEEESDGAADMEGWVDIVRNLETPEIMKYPRVVKLPRTSALSIYATLPPIKEDGGSPRSSEPLPGISDIEHRLSPPVDEEAEEEMEDFAPATDVDSGVAFTQDNKETPATGEKPKPVYSWENVMSRGMDLERSSPLEMMRRHMGNDSNQASRTTGYRSILDQNKPQRQSCSTGTLLLSERLEKKASSFEEKPYSRLDSLLFNTYKSTDYFPYGGMKKEGTLKNGVTAAQVPLVPSSDVRSQLSPDEPLEKSPDPVAQTPALSAPPLPSPPPTLQVPLVPSSDVRHQPRTDEPLEKNQDPLAQTPALSAPPLPSPLPSSLPPLPQHLPGTPHTNPSNSRVSSLSTEAQQSKVQPQAELRAFNDDWQHQDRERGKLNPRPGKMVIFTEPGLQGDHHEIWGDVYDATALELPSVISIRVIRGGWVMYEKSRFQGRKIVLEEGDTELTDPWGVEDTEAEEEANTPVRIGSLRHVVRDYAVPAISLFAEENGEGKKLKFLDASHDAQIFGQPLKTASIIVHSGLWIVYREPFFEGRPSILEPGGYPTLKAWGGEEPLVCSLQPIQIGCPTVEKPYEPKIIMFESPHFEGRSWEINRDIQDLKREDDAESPPLSTVGSLRVLGGCWVGYEKEGFRGQQYLLEEGEYKDWKDWGGHSAELTSIRLIRSDFSEPALVLYAEPDFEDGPSLELCDALPDMELARYGTSTQSIFVHSGVWVAYENVDFSGAQYILEKGTYHCFQDWGASNSQISSLQPVLQVDDPSLHYESKIQLFTEPGFCGDDLIYDEETGTLPEGFNPHSCRVHGGSWILYENVDFAGEHYVLSEGEYPSHTAMGCRPDTVLRSLMQVPIHFSEPSISLHGLESFEGKEIELTGEVRSLQAEGFNNHVLSVRVRGGIWVLYEHCDYRGRQWLLDSTEITNWLQYSGLQHIGSLCPIQQRRIYFHVRNRALQQFLCLKEDAEDMKAARVLVSEASEQARLVWYYEEGRIKNQVAPDMSLQVIGSAHKGAKVVLWSQNRIPSQTWRIDSNGHICNQMFDDMILDVKGGQAYDWDHVVLWDVAEERPTQMWTIEVL